MKECNCHRGPEVGKKTVGCPPKVININHPAEPVLFHRIDIPASMGDDVTYPPTNGLYKNILLVYEANNHTYLYNSDGIPTNLSLDISELEKALATEVVDRKDADLILQGNINGVAQDLEDFKNSPDVVDIVATYADLEAYDTSDLGDQDVIRVLADETHDGESSYYRWNKVAETWTFIGATGPYYTKTETDNRIEAAKKAWVGDETTSSGSGTAVTVTTTTGDFVWAEGNIVTVNFKYKASRSTLNVDGTGAYDIDNVRSLAGGIDSGIAIQYVCVYINNQRYYRPIGRLRASADVAGPVFIEDNLTTTGSNLKALSANQGKVLDDKITGLASSKQNTLTAGDGIDITNDTIKAINTGLAKALTTDYYNWNSTENSSTIEPFDCVALWLLDPGIYTVPSGVSGKIDRDTATSDKKFYMVGPQGLYGVFVADFELLGYTDHVDSSGSMVEAGSLRSVAKSSGLRTYRYTFSSPIDGIGSLSTTHPLSANQGTVLSSRIGNLSELSTFTQSSLVAAINEVNRENNYGSTEKNTEHTWLDAKEIYKKTITCGALPNSTTKSSSHGIPVGDIDRIIDIEGFAYDPVNKVTIPIPDGGDLKISVTETNIVITTTTDYSDYTECFITLYYTKNIQGD